MGFHLFWVVWSGRGNEVMKKLVLAWDSDFTKLTPREAAELKIAHAQVANGEVLDDDEIDWD